MKSHGDEIANNFTFYEVLTHSSNLTTSDDKLSRLRHSCLEPGLYYKHAKLWLKHFPARQLVFLDGELLRSRPHLVLEHLQRFVLADSDQLDLVVDYRRMLVYDSKKGFYCVRQSRRVTGRSRVCLGAGKGRHYASMDDKSRQFLARFYADSNAKFASLLRAKFSHHSPNLTWLNQTLYDLSSL